MPSKPGPTSTTGSRRAAPIGSAPTPATPATPRLAGYSGLGPTPYAPQAYRPRERNPCAGQTQRSSTRSGNGRKRTGRPAPRLELSCTGPPNPSLGHQALWLLGRCAAQSRPAPTTPGQWSRDRIIHALADWATAHQRPPRAYDWKRAGPDHPGRFHVWKRFGSWQAALAAAGLSPLDIPHRADDARQARAETLVLPDLSDPCLRLESRFGSNM